MYWQLSSRAALLMFLLGVVAGSAHAKDLRSGADIAGLTVCLIDADVAVATLEQMTRGQSREVVERAVEDTLPDPVYREYVKRTVGVVYRAKPDEPRVWFTQRLRTCVAGASRTARVDQADACYRLTRYAKQIYRLRDTGVARAEALASTHALAQAEGLSSQSGESLQRLTSTIYGTATPVAQLRTGLFVSCVLPKPK